MVIESGTAKDLREILRLYKLATLYQKEKFPGNQWPEFDLSMIEEEIRNKRLFKIVIDGQIACIWSITHTDSDIWIEDDGISALYIHRIATNPKFRGNNFVRTIVDWARVYAEDKKYIRMDTGGRNQKLIDYYVSCGFEFLGIRKLGFVKSLPSHYHHAEICYFELKL